LLAVFLTALLGVPLFAQMEFSGEWAPVLDEDNAGNPYVGEFVGISDEPCRNAPRAGVERIALYAAGMAVPSHGAMYISRGPSQVRIWKEVDPDSREIVAFHAEWLRSIDNPYYMDGRPRPSKYAPHTFGGFSTAEFVGDTLKITTTHLKRRLLSPQRRSVERRSHADAILAAARRYPHLDHHRHRSSLSQRPMIRASEYRLVLPLRIPPYPCTVIEEVDRPAGVVRVICRDKIPS